MQAPQRVQGRWIQAEDIVWLRNWIDEHPHWSRKRIAQRLCERWQWCDARGRLKDFAARSFLLKLEAEGHLSLPPLQMHQRRVPRAVWSLENWQRPATWSASLHAIGPVSVEPILPGTRSPRTWAFYLTPIIIWGCAWLGRTSERARSRANGRAGRLRFFLDHRRVAGAVMVIGNIWSAPERFPKNLLQTVLAHRSNYDLAFSPVSFMLRVKRMNATIDLNIAVQVTVRLGSKFNISKGGEL